MSIVKLVEKSRLFGVVSNDDLIELTKLVVKECCEVALNTDDQNYIVELEGYELGSVHHSDWTREILDSVETVKNRFAIE